MRKLTVRIKRYDPERDDAPHWETYRVEADPTDRVLDVLLGIKWEQDDTQAAATPARRRLRALRRRSAQIRYRSPEPVLTPESPQERRGAVADVVFPTGIDRRDDLGSPDRFDVYYGMADDRIGVVRFDLPESLPTGALADSPEHKV